MISKPVAIFAVVGLFLAMAIREGTKEPPTAPAVTAETTTTPAATAAPAKTTAAEAAEIGDEVALRYPASTIMCSERAEASKLYVIGKLAVAETMRVENNANRAIEAGIAEQKHAMRKFYSCGWAVDKMRYRVEEKEITGTEKALFHTVSFCLRSIGESSCRWLIETFDYNSPFENVRKP